MKKEHFYGTTCTVLALVLTQIVNTNIANIIANINAKEALPIAPMELLLNMLELLESPPSPSPSQLSAIMALTYWRTGKTENINQKL